eukprot:4017-Lingulodinium_polyedra.AAC.1
MSRLGCQARWVPRANMAPDCATKIDPMLGNLALPDLLRKGTLMPVGEEGHMNERALSLSLKSRSRAA